MNPLTLKDQIDISFKVGEQIDRYWQMFIYTNFVVAIALGTTFISRATAGQISITVADHTVPMVFLIQLFIVIFFYIFLFMNFGALKEAYRGFQAIVTDIKRELHQLDQVQPVVPKHFVAWVDSFNYTDRINLVRGIFAYAVLSVTSVILIFGAHMSQGAAN